MVHDCAQVEEYVRAGCTTHINNKICLPNGQPIPYDGTKQGLKVAIDTWWATQPTPALAAPAPAQTHIVFMQETPPHMDVRCMLPSQIEEVVETHILQVKEVANPAEEQEIPHDIFEVFATEKKQCEFKVSKLPEFVTPPADAQPHATSSDSTLLGPQF
jgi:hypothetical protein